MSEKSNRQKNRSPTPTKTGESPLETDHAIGAKIKTPEIEIQKVEFSVD